ncbi:MAG: hypothetical protein H6867_01955 [Rhodospirillales bacterium]|nr:hypothetical protein [Rhodospirillales bacterium]MCB9997282.1 hypothetical protein [Rhodospirillales bacterium]
MAKKEKSMLEGERVIPENVPLNPDLISEMLIDIAVNKDSDVWVCHDKPFPAVLEWVEYDPEEARLVFITKGGRLNDFGIEIGPVMAKYLVKAREADVYLIADDKIQDYIKVPLVLPASVH